jgi:RNA polymerase sigma factor (sigma-70 family)
MPTEPLKELFQQQFVKMVAVISNLFGLQHIELAEDIVSDTFLTAAEEWEKSGMPPNPTAWLYTVAKRKTIHQFRRQKIFDRKVAPALSSEATNSTEPIELDFSPQHIRDSQLQMLFAVCTPAIASEAQIGLALRILCGFGIDEIAEAFLSNKETINKRLFRAKEKLRTENIRLGLPPETEISARLDNVLHIIYLLFSEGYYSQTQNRILQKELCWEAMRLGVLLTDYELTNTPKTNALLALMCFHASRFNARQTSEAAVILYEHQDERLWDTDLIRQGMQYLDQSASGDKLSSYHLEARIASWHCIKEDTPGKWEEILQLYNQLLLVNYSPSVALNRTFALYKANGIGQALIEAEKLKLDNDHFYYLLLGFLYKDADAEKAKMHWEKAYSLARTEPERREISERIRTLPLH